MKDISLKNVHYWKHSRSQTRADHWQYEVGSLRDLRSCSGALNLGDPTKFMDKDRGEVVSSEPTEFFATLCASLPIIHNFHQFP